MQETEQRDAVEDLDVSQQKPAADVGGGAIGRIQPRYPGGKRLGLFGPVTLLALTIAPATFR